MDLTLVIGTGAALVSTVSFLPQAWKIIRTRNTSGISTGMYAMTVAGFLLWLGYGLLRGEWPLIVPNAICLFVSSFIFAMKLLPKRSMRSVADALNPSAN
jgi:MtN3 and saliva related transmembrane protein